MTSVVDDRRRSALRRAAVRATLAPSVHNTQPWRLHLRGDELSIFADRTRRLPVLDPLERQLVISCGSALMNARVALAAAGFDVLVERYPDPLRHDLLARLTTIGDLGADPADDAHALARLDDVVEARQINRRRFDGDEIPDEVLAALAAAVALEHATLTVVRRAEHLLALAVVSQQADAIENADPAYRAELRAWTTDDPSRPDGVSGMAVPHVDGRTHDDVPQRDFDTRGTGYLPAGSSASLGQCFVLLGTVEDSPVDWLRSGEALERLLLELTRLGLVAEPMTQAIEVPFAREELRAELELTTHPQILLRLGHASAGPTSRRRRLVDVLVEDS